MYMAYPHLIKLYVNRLKHESTYCPCVCI